MLRERRTMKRIYCDRCGVEGKPRGEEGPRVVTVTFAPLGRTLDLCGSCRGILNFRLDSFVVETLPPPDLPLPRDMMQRR